MLDRPKLIALFTDFGVTGPYNGQMHAILTASGAEQSVIQLLADAPQCNPQLSAYLLAALAADMPEGTLFISVVDPGVGAERRPIVVKDSSQWFVGPDNGLLSLVARRSGLGQAELIEWRPATMSASFHGRDLFAPVAAAICQQQHVATSPISLDSLVGSEWPDDLARIIYIDAFGNAITGVRVSVISENMQLCVAGVQIPRARTFSDVAPGEAFWYANSNGLVEIAVNQGSASERLGIGIGSLVEI